MVLFFIIVGGIIMILAALAALNSIAVELCDVNDDIVFPSINELQSDIEKAVKKCEGSPRADSIIGTLLKSYTKYVQVFNEHSKISDTYYHTEKGEYIFSIISPMMFCIIVAGKLGNILEIKALLTLLILAGMILIFFAFRVLFAKHKPRFIEEYVPSIRGPEKYKLSRITEDSSIGEILNKFDALNRCTNTMDRQLKFMNDKLSFTKIPRVIAFVFLIPLLIHSLHVE